MYIYIQSICKQQFFCCLRAQQYSSDQKKILKDQSAQTTGRVVSIALCVCVCVCVYVCIIYIYIYIHIYVIYVYVYIHIYMCLPINKNKCIRYIIDNLTNQNDRWY